MTDYRHWRSGSGIIKTLPEFLDARARKHRVYEVEGATVREVVSLRYRSPTDAEGIDWAAVEAELSAEYETRGEPHCRHPDPQWRSITQIARRYVAIDEEDPSGVSLRAARRRVSKILKHLRLKP